MSIGISPYSNQVIPLGIILLAGLWYSCTRSPEEVSITPPPTHPLSRTLVGYGVINVPFTRVMQAPRQGEISLGHLRRGSIVEIIARRSVNAESWVLIDGIYQGWIRARELDIYDLAVQAETAAELMSQP